MGARVTKPKGGVKCDFCGDWMRQPFRVGDKKGWCSKGCAVRAGVDIGAALKPIKRTRRMARAPKPSDTSFENL